MLNHPDGYTSYPGGPLHISDAAGMGIRADVRLLELSDPATGVPGGNLGGYEYPFTNLLAPGTAVMALEIHGIEGLTGFNRQILMPIAGEVHSAPRTPGDAVQDFDTEMFRLDGEITGDPDFDLLRITAGTDNGFPGAGHTTLTRLGPPGSDFAVDSFFDITYHIDFTGANGSWLEGMSGPTNGTIRVNLGHEDEPVPEPSGLGLIGMALVALHRKRRRR